MPQPTTRCFVHVFCSVHASCTRASRGCYPGFMRMQACICRCTHSHAYVATSHLHADNKMLLCVCARERVCGPDFGKPITKAPSESVPYNTEIMFTCNSGYWLGPGAGINGTGTAAYATCNDRCGYNTLGLACRPRKCQTDVQPRNIVLTSR
jgi:hypothetical protein